MAKSKVMCALYTLYKNNKINLKYLDRYIFQNIFERSKTDIYIYNMFYCATINKNKISNVNEF